MILIIAVKEEGNTMSKKAECDNCIWNVCNYNKIDWEASEDCISRLRDYQIEWLTSHADIELEPKLEKLIIRFLNDTTEMFSEENAPSVAIERKRGEWTNAGMLTVHCSNCKSEFHELEAMNFCPNCGADMRGAK